MNPKAFSNAFYDWVKDVHICELAGKQINIDGKTLRGALNKKGNCNVHIVHAWVHEEGMKWSEKVGQFLTKIRWETRLKTARTLPVFALLSFTPITHF